MHDRTHRVRRALLVALMLVAQTVGRSGAAEPGDAEMSFHRVYVPADRIDAWPRGSVRYVPMDREAFERTVAEMAAESQAPANRHTRLERAVYAARLDEDGVLRGRAEWTVSHSAERAALLPLGGCDLAITAAAWTEEPTQAVLGTTADGALSVLVERPGTLRVDFVLRGASRSGRDAFDAQIPSGAATRWLLDAPLAATPAVEAGVVVPTAEQAASADGQTPGENREPPRRVWKIELGQGNRLALTVAKPQAAGEQVVAARQTTDYAIDASGLAMQTKLVLGFHHDAANRVTLRLDPEATLVGASVADEAARVIDFRRAADGGQWLTMELPPTVRGAERVLTLDAIAPTVLGKRWRLPRLVADGIPWQEAEARVVVSSPLRIAQLWPTNAQLAGAASVDSATLTYLAADASIDAVVDFAPRETHAGTALLVEVGSEARGQAVLDAAFGSATSTTLTGRIHEQWLVEGVTATPADAVDDWRIATDERGRATLIVECRPGTLRAARIVATIRRRESPEQRPIAAGELRAIDWRESCNVTRSVASIAATRAYRLSTVGSHRVATVRPGDEAAKRLLGDHPGQLQFDVDSAGLRFAVSARRAATPFRGEVDVESFCSGESVHDTIRLRCLPQGDGLTQIVLRVTPPTTASTTWKDAQNPEAEVTARRLSDDEARAFLIEPGSEAWLFGFDEPRTATFELVGTRTRPLEAITPVALAALQNAAGQSGIVTVRAARETKIEIENRRLTPVPEREESLSELGDVRGTFRFVPTRDVTAIEAAATIVRGDAQTGESAIAYACDTTVRIEAGGRAVLRTTYFLENFGRTHVVVGLPEGTSRHESSVDGQTAVEADAGGDAMRISLPSGRRFVRVTVDFDSAEKSNGAFSEQVFHAPSIDVPVLGRRWTLAMPENLSVLCGGEHADLSWRERWFGPLARRDEQAAFDPLSWSSWLGRNSGRSDSATANDAVEALLLRIGRAREALAGEKVATWAALLAAADDEQTFVDASALDRAGIEPWTPLPTRIRESAEAAAVRLLFDAGLAVVTDGSRCAITSMAAAGEARDAEILSPPRYGGVRLIVVRVGTGEGDAMTAPGRVVAAKDWAALVGTHALPWSAEASPPAWRGWRRVRLSADGESVSVRLVDSGLLRSAAWVAFLASAALAWSWFRRSRTFCSRAVWWSLVATACASLTLDANWLGLAPLLWGTWWGGCLGAILARLPTRRRGHAVGVAMPGAPSWRLRKAVTATLLAVAMLLAVRAWADDEPKTPDATANRAKPSVQQVFFPVDDDQKPVGSRVYVPESLFARLERWNLERERGPQGAVVASAVQQFQLDWNADGSAIEVREGTAIVDVVTFDDDARVRLPISSAGDSADGGVDVAAAAAIRIDGALVDRESLSVVNGAISLAIAKAGAHRIDMPVSSATAVRGGRQELVLHPLPAGISRVEIASPQNGPEIEVLSVSDGVVVHRGRGMLSWPQSGERSYAIRWAPAAPRTGAERLASAERLWLDVRPGSVGFAAEVVISSEATLPDELRVAADPRLVPLSANVDGVATTWRRAGADGDQLAFRLSAASGAREARLEIKFLMQDTAGIGALRLPRWEPVVAEVRRRWVAISIDDTLEHEISAGPESPPMPAADFVQDESEDVLPRYVYRLPTGNATLSLTTRRRTQRVRFDPAVAVLAEPSGARVVLDAEIAVLSGDVYSHTLRCDPRLRVERLSVAEDAADRVAYWTQAADGVVQVFLNQRAASRQRLRLEGRIAADVDGSVEIDEIALDGGERSPTRLRLYRTPAVRVKVGDLTGFADSANEAASSAAASPHGERFVPPADARLVRDLVSAAAGAPVAIVQIEPNAPRIDAATHVAIESLDADAWSVRAHFRGAVADGIADDLVLDLPGDWIGEPSIEPAMPMTEIDATDGARRFLVRPALPLRGTFAFSVAGRMRTPASRAAPRWRLMDADVQREFCVLPTRWRGRSMRWDVVEMRPVSPGKGFLMPQRDGARFEAFELLGEGATAAMQADVPSAMTLEAYVDVAATSAGNGSQSIIATYDLLPSGVTSCQFELPARARVVATLLEGRAVSPRRLGDGKLHVELQSASLPQRLQFVVVADAGEASGKRQTWVVPKLLDATVRQTSWTVSTASGQVVAATLPLSEGRAVDAARAKMLAETWATATSSSSEHKAFVARRWQRRLAAAMREASGTRKVDDWRYVVAGEGDATTQAAIDGLSQQFGATRLGRFGPEILFELPATQAGRFADQLQRDGGPAASAMVFAALPKIVERSAFLRSALLRSSTDDRPVAAFVADGAAWTLETSVASSTRVPWTRWSIATAVIGVAIALTRRGPRRAIAEVYARRPYLAVVALGVAWQLWLWPAWIGWIFVGLGVALAWRMTWPLPRVDVRARPSSTA